MNVFAELKRRNVIRVGLAYGVLGWLLTEVSSVVLPTFGAPTWVMKVLIFAVLLGFVPTLVFSWVYELTPEGLKKESEIDRGLSIARVTGRRLDYLTMGLVLLGLVLMGVDRYLPRYAPTAEPDSTAAGARLGEVVPANSIAVLPFVDMSAAGNQEYFGDGLAEEILNLLAGIKGLKVTGRTSSFAFKGKDTGLAEIGRTLGVTHLLEGSVRKAGNRLRITAQLVKASDGFHLWSETYDRQLEDIFVIQDDIAGAIAQSLKLTLVPAKKSATDNLPAYDLYLQARELITGRTPSGLHRARGLIDRALALDPDYAPALTASAELWMLLSDDPSSYGEIPEAQANAQARKLLDRALSLDPKLADAHAAAGLLSINLHDYEAAGVHLQRALSINPSLTNANHWRALTLSRSGRIREALSAAQRFAVLDPLFLTNLQNLVIYFTAAGQAEPARQLAQRLQRSYPDRDGGFLVAAFLNQEQGRLAAAAVAIEHGIRLGGNRGLVRWIAETIYFALGDYPRVQDQNTGWNEAEVMIAQGQTQQGLDRIRTRLLSSPDNETVIWGRLHGLSLAGRHATLLQWIGQRWGDAASLDAAIAYDSSEGGTLEPLAAAQRATGHRAELDETLKVWAGVLDFLADQGHANSAFRYHQATWQALSGHRDAALAGLSKAIDAGYRDPLIGRRAAFEPWWRDADFELQFARMKALINVERDQLGREPLP